MKRKDPSIHLSVARLENHKPTYICARWATLRVSFESSRLGDDVPRMSAQNNGTHSPRNARKIYNRVNSMAVLQLTRLLLTIGIYVLEWRETFHRNSQHSTILLYAFLSVFI